MPLTVETACFVYFLYSTRLPHYVRQEKPVQVFLRGLSMPALPFSTMHILPVNGDIAAICMLTICNKSILLVPAEVLRQCCCLRPDCIAAIIIFCTARQCCMRICLQHCRAGAGLPPWPERNCIALCKAGLKILQEHLKHS